MLGVKSTRKDRWRQVLAEADRIDDKHLLTLETAISRIRPTKWQQSGCNSFCRAVCTRPYTPAQQVWLMDVVSFTELVRARQNA